MPLEMRFIIIICYDHVY